MVIVIDSQIAGISGDMFLSALVNLGANKTKILNGIKTAQNFLTGSTITKIEFSKIKKHGTEATELVLEYDEENKSRKGIEIKKCISDSIKEIKLSNKAKQFALSSIQTLIEAESKIHGESCDSVHFHEASSIDTVVDILGTAIALDDLDFFSHEIISSYVGVGGGTLTFSHGKTSNPADAILEIFKNSGIIIVGGQVDEEITTPTGACMLVNLTKSCFEYYPPMKINSIGYGAGQKDFKNFSNVLKIIQGEKLSKYSFDTVKILETNLDDISGEVLGNMIDKLMNAGAKDVTVSSAITKKGRPTNLVTVICDSNTMNSLLEILFSETGTLGVRVRTNDRVIISRQLQKISIDLEEKNFLVHYKTKGIESNDFKIESEDIKSISNALNKSFRETEELIRTQIKKKLGN